MQSVAPNVWSFASYDAGGMSVFCASQCTTTPQVVFNPNYGTHQATLRIEPRLDVELWQVSRVVVQGQVVAVPTRLAELTVHLKVRAFAECVGWESGNGRLNAHSGAGDLSFTRDTGILEDIADFFVPGLTAGVNRQIRDSLLSQLHIGRYAPLPLHNGGCVTLGVSGDAASGAILWNPPCLTVACQVTGGPGGPGGPGGEHAPACGTAG